jgi:BirA family biotin operon repressor/biotin-[acetyl-CoA-carboxylase] ligase
MPDRPSKVFAASPRRGNSFAISGLRAGLKPFRLHFFPTLRSTSDHAAVLRKRGELFAPAVVLTTRQTAGKGRGANTWFSAAGSLTATFVLPINQTFAPHQLPLAAGLAVRNALAEISRNEQIQLKWPNDVVVSSQISNPKSQIQKLAGLLCERLDNVDLIGIGINVNSPRKLPPLNLRDRIIFLQNLQNAAVQQQAPLDLTNVLLAVARHLHTMLIRKSETPFPTLLREYDHHHALVGRTITVRSPNEPPITGKCQGLDDMGRLLLRSRSRLHHIIAGHVELA